MCLLGAIESAMANHVVAVMESSWGSGRVFSQPAGIGPCKAVPLRNAISQGSLWTISRHKAPIRRLDQGSEANAERNLLLNKLYTTYSLYQGIHDSHFRSQVTVTGNAAHDHYHSRQLEFRPKMCSPFLGLKALANHVSRPRHPVDRLGQQLSDGIRSIGLHYRG